MPKTSKNAMPKQRRGTSAFGGEAQLSATSQYLEDISRWELLTATEETELSLRSLACEAAKSAIGEMEKDLADLRDEAEAFDDLPGSGGEALRFQTRIASDIAELEERITVARAEAAAVIESGEEAQTALVNHNLRLVVTIAKEYRRSGIPLLDLIQAGNEGLMHAARKFDRENFPEVKFSNYAPYWVKQRLMKFTTEHGYATRVPPYRSWSLHKITKVSSQLMQRLGRTATAAEIARETGYDLEEVREVMKILQPNVDLDSSIKGDPAAGDLRTYFGESTSDAEAREEEQVQQIAFKKIAERALGVLDEREARIITLHYGLDGEAEHGLDEIGEIFGFTRERARQIRAKALDKIRESGVIDDERDA